MVLVLSSIQKEILSSLKEKSLQFKDSKTYVTEVTKDYGEHNKVMEKEVNDLILFGLLKIGTRNRNERKVCVWYNQDEPFKIVINSINNKEHIYPEDRRCDESN